jgi:sulfur-carrier protein adenylyltransferase/sulfurtransferase
MSFHEINAEELRRFIGNHHENKYLLVDVRQPGEYEEGHIPGARLLPLPELPKRMDTLPLDKELVFYCRSGSRSMAASTMVEEESPQAEVYNLDGGILAWEGGVVMKPPQVRLFGTKATVEQMLMTAMDLEKGAMKFYTMADERWGGEEWSEVFARLAEAEIGHAMMIYQLLRREKDIKGDFDTVFSRLLGDVLEGGMSLAEALDRAASAKNRLCIHLIELALNIEYSAFDLYRTMADRATDSEARDVFLKISQAEKSHMNILIGALGTCP